MRISELNQAAQLRLKWWRSPVRIAAALLLVAGLISSSAAQAALGPPTYIGFDRNDYPGNANLKALRQTFSYAGYWLNHPPGEKLNSWSGHRPDIESAGFGFLLLFNGRLYAEMRGGAGATKLGRSDAGAAAAAAQREGFAKGAIIFLDQEQGGRMLPEQKAYIYAWVDGVVAAGYRAGIYCSGIASPDEGNVVTAEDIRSSAGARQIVYWAINDSCPPAPGCSFAQHPPAPATSGVNFAEVWQFAQSPQRKDVAGRCTNYKQDGECYAPGVAAPQKMHVDLNSSTSSDPSHARQP